MMVFDGTGASVNRNNKKSTLADAVSPYDMVMPPSIPYITTCDAMVMAQSPVMR